MQSAEAKVCGSIPQGDSEFFLCPTLVTRRKTSFSIPRNCGIMFFFSVNETRVIAKLYGRWLEGLSSTRVLD